MELKNDTTENSKFAYEDDNRPNPNDSLFGSIGEEEPYKITSTYTGYNDGTVKKSNTSIGGFIGVIAVVAILIGAIIFFVKGLGGPYDGKYELAIVEVQGQRITVEQLEQLSGLTIEMELEINGKKGYLKMDYSYMKDEGEVDVEIDGNKIILKNGRESVTFTYNEEDDTVVFEEDGNYLILEKVK